MEQAFRFLWSIFPSYWDKVTPAQKALVFHNCKLFLLFYTEFILLQINIESVEVANLSI